MLFINRLLLEIENAERLMDGDGVLNAYCVGIMYKGDYNLF